MAELVAILEAMRESDYADKKFAAAMQGVDLDKQTGRRSRPSEPKGSSTFEDIQARVSSGGLAKDADDILSMSGQYGARKGFQIGKDMDYAKFTQGDERAPKNPLG